MGGIRGRYPDWGRSRVSESRDVVDSGIFLHEGKQGRMCTGLKGSDLAAPFHQTWAPVLN